jgi:hypothetical protein
LQKSSNNLRLHLSVWVSSSAKREDSAVAVASSFDAKACDGIQYLFGRFVPEEGLGGLLWCWIYLRIAVPTLCLSGGRLAGIVFRERGGQRSTRLSQLAEVGVKWR